MTYNDSEISVSSGKPIELYDFSFGGSHWRYNTSSESIVYEGAIYEPEVIERGNMEISDNFFKNELDIKMSRDNEFGVQFIASPPEGIIALVIYRGHEGNYITYWMGVMSSITFNSNEITIKVSPKTAGLLRTGLRRKYQKLCNFALYEGNTCKVATIDFEVSGTVLNVSGLEITSVIFGTKEDGWFVAGKIVIGNSVRMITAHVGNVITITSRMPVAVTGISFFAYAGCDHSMETCRTKFNNLDNYGGQPWMPTKNPFSGDAII